ncbi:RNA polymerase factor sigma-32 [Candidatus Lariskella endosymbiont of Hedychridium roseum]|uniref:RNA polymerase factor sigma-32 n=1 Tax=Candidatus Lariskella endosymbiont of Hedychridium roseum TaxID=3077949 RepID=UPI0030D10E16
MAAKAFLPTIVQESGVAAYLEEIQKIPMLSAEEEYSLAVRCRDHADLGAAHKLVTSHLKLVAKIAMRFRHYGIPLIDIIAEGNIGLMHAVKKFDPDMGHRLSTYAMWWIKAAIQDYILKSWSLVKVGTSVIQKKLFFNLKKARDRIGLVSGRKDEVATNAEVSEELGIEKKYVDAAFFNAGCVSLHGHAYGDEDDAEIIDTIPASEETQENMIIEKYDTQSRMKLLSAALDSLNERERDIITERRLREKPSTLDALSVRYNVSRERIRQIEERTLQKIRDFMRVSWNS